MNPALPAMTPITVFPRSRPTKIGVIFTSVQDISLNKCQFLEEKEQGC